MVGELNAHLGVLVHTFNSGTREAVLMDLYKFEVSLIHITSSRSATLQGYIANSQPPKKMKEKKRKWGLMRFCLICALESTLCNYKNQDLN